MIAALLTAATVLSAALMVFMALMWTVNEAVLTDPGSDPPLREQAALWRGRFTALTGLAALMSVAFFLTLRGL